MSAPLTTTTLDAVYQAIVQTLKTTYGERLATVGPFDPERLLDPDQPIATPAMVVAIEGLDADPDDARPPVRGRAATRLSCAIHILLSARTEGLQTALDVLASSVHVLVRQPDADTRLSAHPGQRWGLGPAAHPPEMIVAMPSAWTPGQYGLDSRVVRWSQVVYLPDDPIACLAEPAPDPEPVPVPAPDADPDPDTDPDPEDPTP
jgi:hypothetical protein